jgi:hypothetical protein
MRTQLIHGSGRVWRAAGLAVSGAAVVLTIGAFGAAPARAGGGGGGGGNQGPLILVFTSQPTTTQISPAVMPPVVVTVEYQNHQVDCNYNGNVVLKYAVNRLGAPLPAQNQVKAKDGIATFSDLTFSAVGFGFELVAEIPGQSEESWSPGWGGPGGQGDKGGQGWTGGQGGKGGQGEMSTPSAPFDIVDQILQCQSEETCQTNSVSSDGTSGFATATGGELIATGGGFPDLSCGTLGGVLTFSSTEGQTITTTLPGYLAGHRPLWSFNICWGAPEPFTTKSGGQSQFNTANNEYEGLLPACRPCQHAPCVKSRSRTWPWGAVTITILAPAGDPRPMWE